MNLLKSNIKELVQQYILFSKSTIFKNEKNIKSDHVNILESFNHSK